MVRLLDVSLVGFNRVMRSRFVLVSGCFVMLHKLDRGSVHEDLILSFDI